MSPHSRINDRQIEQDLAPTRKRLPNQRWQIAPPQAEKAQALSLATGLLPLVAQVMINRDIATAADAHGYIDPESQDLPSPLDEFTD
ncbi:MAG: single-stranded-DNA-specific exonuclease RecJ, partial [Waterburya sp.]